MNAITRLSDGEPGPLTGLPDGGYWQVCGAAGGHDLVFEEILAMAAEPDDGLLAVQGEGVRVRPLPGADEP